MSNLRTHWRPAAYAGILVAGIALVGCGTGSPVVDAPGTTGAMVQQLIVSDGKIEHASVSFDDALSESDRIVIVDFSATWCGPCRMLEPELEKVAVELQDDVIVLSVDVDEHKPLARHFQVSGIPDVRFFHGGKSVGGFGGYYSADKIVSRLKTLKTGRSEGASDDS